MEKGGGAEYPPDKVIWTVRGDQGPDHGEGHRQDRDTDYALFYEDLARGATIEDGEQQAARS